MTQEEIDRALDSLYPEHRDGITVEEVIDLSTGELELTSSDATQILTALLADRVDLVQNLLDRAWSRSCGFKVYAMTTWMHAATFALRQEGLTPTFVCGTEDGTPKADMNDVEMAVETYANLITQAINNGDPERVHEVMVAAHELICKGSDQEARGMFSSVLVIAADALRRALTHHIENHAKDGNAGDSSGGDDLLEQIFGNKS